tara:strand:+ start:296 stop:976 length:681 start_codon:yes stop_codon:yes gene_type:complete
MLRFFISLFTVFFINISHANVNLKNDTIEKFGIRAGIDLNKIIRSASNSNYTGLSINGDIRIKKSLYIFSEIGNEEKKINSDYLNSTVKGTYLKVGANFKLNNDIKTENLFYSGLILGFSNFNQSIDNYTIYNTNSTYWGESYIDESLSLSNLNAVWFEIVFGLKTEIFNNLFLGFELQLKNVLKQKNSQGITNFYIPGFNRTYDSSDFGAGFSYTISYLIPIIKK